MPMRYRALRLHRSSTGRVSAIVQRPASSSVALPSSLRTRWPIQCKLGRKNSSRSMEAPCRCSDPSRTTPWCAVSPARQGAWSSWRRACLLRWGRLLENRLAQAPGLQIMIVLDADEETCRLGYCDAPSLETLSRSAAGRGIPIRQQRGIRIGLLMADDEILVWTPTPLMFEAPRDTDEPNGLLLHTGNPAETARGARC
jgi:hypothetical protein